MSTSIIPIPPPVSDHGNQQVAEYKGSTAFTMSSRALQEARKYVSFWPTKKIETKDIKYSHGTTTMTGLIRVLEEIGTHGSDAFGKDVAVIKTHIKNELNFGDFQLFRTAYDCQRSQIELELIVLYARKSTANDVEVVDYMMATYLHKRQQNQSAKLSGRVTAMIGAVVMIAGLFLTGPVGWAAIGVGGVSTAAGLGTAISGTDDKISGLEEIEVEHVGHMLESGLTKRLDTD